MRTRWICTKCHPVDGPPGPTRIAELTTERGTVVTCDVGHKWLYVAQASGWALLFTRAVRRVAVGNRRDAVLDAYTAFEMYLSQVPARARYDRELGAGARALIDDMSKVVKRAEPALGAARAVASLVSASSPISWKDEKTSTLRNNAVHAGKYPSQDEAEACCEEVARLILAFEAALAKGGCVNPRPFHEQLWVEDCDRLRAENPDAQPVWMGGVDIFDWTQSDASRPTVRGMIEAYRAAPSGLNGLL